MYSEKLIYEFRNPKNFGTLDNANGIGEEGNPYCGDKLKIFLFIEDNMIKDVSFLTFGCAAAIASSSIATELIKGKDLEYALNLNNSDIYNTLDGMPIHKLHCSLLAEKAIKAAIKDYKDKVKEEIAGIAIEGTTKETVIAGKTIATETVITGDTIVTETAVEGTTGDITTANITGDSATGCTNGKIKEEIKTVDRDRKTEKRTVKKAEKNTNSKRKKISEKKVKVQKDINLKKKSKVKVY